MNGVLRNLLRCVKIQYLWPTVSSINTRLCMVAEPHSFRTSQTRTGHIWGGWFQGSFTCGTGLVRVLAGGVIGQLLRRNGNLAPWVQSIPIWHWQHVNFCKVLCNVPGLHFGALGLAGRADNPLFTSHSNKLPNIMSLQGRYSGHVMGRTPQIGTVCVSVTWPNKYFVPSRFGKT